MYINFCNCYAVEMGDLIYDLTSGASWFQSMSWIPAGGAMSDSALLITLLFAAFGSLLLNNYTRSLGMFSLPLNFAVLFFGGLFGNAVLAGTKLPFENHFHEPMLFALSGMTLAAISVMAVVRSEA